MVDPDRPAPADRPASRGPKMTRGESIVAVAGVLLAADLAFLPWHHYSLDTSALAKLGVQIPNFTHNVNGLKNPQAFFGLAAFVIALGMAALVLASVFTQVVPRQEQLHLIAGPVVFGLVMAKFLANHQFLGPGAYIGMVLAALVAYGGFLLSQEAPASSDRPAPPGG